MSSHLTICGSLNNDCHFLSSDGSCSAPNFFCENKIGYHGSSEFVVTRDMMRNLRTLHQENMELKKLLLGLKQNQK